MTAACKAAGGTAGRRLPASSSTRLLCSDAPRNCLLHPCCLQASPELHPHGRTINMLALPTRGTWPAAAACTLHSRSRSRPSTAQAAIRPGASGDATAPPAAPPPLASYDLDWLWRQSLVMGTASTVPLGPLCDGQHSAHDVLHYASPSFLALGPWQLETCW